MFRRCCAPSWSTGTAAAAAAASSFVLAFCACAPSAAIRFCSTSSSSPSSSSSSPLPPPPTAAPRNPADPTATAKVAADGLRFEREYGASENDQLRHQHYERLGMDVGAVKDREFDQRIEMELLEQEEREMKARGATAAAGAASLRGDDFMAKMRVKVVLPDKQNPEENKFEIKPGQPFREAVEEMLERTRIKEDAAKEALARSKKVGGASAGVSSSSSRTKLEKEMPLAAPPAPGAPNPAVPKPPPLPNFAAGSAAAAAPPLPPLGGAASDGAAAGAASPTDDEICYHLRGIIERSAAKTSADVTTLQLSLTPAIVDAIAKRHNHSLRMFVAKFPARFQMDPSGLPRVHLVGIPGVTPVAAAAAPTTAPGAQAGRNPAAAPPAMKPITPQELKKQMYQQKSQQQQQQQQQPSSGAAVPKPAPPLPGSPAASVSSPGGASPAAPSLSGKFSAPSLPPLPKMPGSSSAAAGGGGAPGAPMQAVDPMQAVMQSAFMTKTWRSPAEVVDHLMEYIPSYWVPMKAVHNHMPFELKELYQDKMKLSQFLRKFSYYFDSKLTQRGAEVKVRDDCKHPKKGAADDRYGQHQRRHLMQQEQAKTEFDERQKQRMYGMAGERTGVLGISEAVDAGAAAAAAAADNSSSGSVSVAPRKPDAVIAATKPRFMDVDAHSLAGQLKQLCSNSFVPVKEFQAGLPNTITSHPEYDASAGVLPALEKHPFIFQVVDGAVRLRQAGTAPNALDKLGRDASDSPLPPIFAKVLQALPEHPGDCSFVDISAILAKLSSEERNQIRAQYRSFPRFLRLHGAAIEVSRDNTTVRRWEEPPMSSASKVGGGGGGGLTADDAELDQQSGEVEDPFEPQLGDGAAALPKAGSVADASAVQWALKELYSSLPLSTAVPLDDAVSMLPAQMREAVQQADPSLVAELAKYPDYFLCWPSPDDPTGKTHIVMRTMIGVPEFELDEISATVKALTPQGGISVEKLMRRVPPRMQRYLFRHGLKATLMKRPDEFLVVGDKVLSLAMS